MPKTIMKIRSRTAQRCFPSVGASLGRCQVMPTASAPFAMPAQTDTINATRRTLSEVPRGPELAVRLASVLEVVYLIFNEG